MKTKLALIGIMFVLFFLLLGCGDTDIDINTIDIDAIDHIDIPAGTYEIEYQIEDLIELIKTHGAVVSFVVIDSKNQELQVSGNSFTAIPNEVYTVTIKLEIGLLHKEKTITVATIKTLSQLATPDNLSLYQNNYLTFNSVEHATSYVISINGQTYTQASNMYDLTALYDTPATYTIKIRAIATGYLDSNYSNEFVISTIIESIAIISSVTTSYIEGDALDYNNIVIEATYTDQRKIILNTTTCLISIPERRALTPFDHIVQITHSSSGKSVSFEITVAPLGDAKWTLTFNGGGGTRIAGGLEIQLLDHHSGGIAPEYAWKDHLFLGFDQSFDSITANTTITALWLDLLEGTNGLDYDFGPGYTDYIVTGYWGSSENVVIPQYYLGLPVKRINNQAFLNNKTVKSLYISSLIDSLGNNVFTGATNLQNIIVSEDNHHLSSIDGVLFEKSKKDLVYCPEGKTGDYTIPDGVTKIYTQAFISSKLNNIFIPDSVYDIGSKAFYNTKWLNEQPNGLIYAGKVVYTYKGSMPANSVIELLEGTLGIAGDAFEMQDNLIELITVEGLLAIGDYAFNGCDNLIDFIIPNSVIRVGTSTFNYCTSLLNIYIPETLLELGSQAFDNTPWYTSQPLGMVYAGNIAYRYKGDFPNSIILKEGTLAIADYAFYQMNDNFTLKNLYIPNSVLKIGIGAFIGVKGIEIIYLPASVESISMFAFSGTGMDIYAEASSEPLGWVLNWNPDPRPVIYSALNQAVTYNFVENGGNEVDSIHAVFLNKFPDIQKEGYDFIGWYDNIGLIGAPLTLPYFTKSDSTLYAKWEIRIYKVEFRLPSSWTRTGGGTLLQNVEHGQDATPPDFNSGEENFVAWSIDYHHITRDLTIVPARAILKLDTYEWASFVWLSAELGNCELEIDFHDGKGYVPFYKGESQALFENMTLSPRASYLGGEWVNLKDFVIDNVDRTNPTKPIINYWLDDVTEGNIIIKIIGGKPNGGSEVTHYYQINPANPEVWLTFSGDFIEISVPNGSTIIAKTVNNSTNAPSRQNRRVITIHKQIYDTHSKVTRYNVVDYEFLSDGSGTKVTSLNGSYDDERHLFENFIRYTRGSAYLGCGPKAAEIFTNWFGYSYGQSIIADDYVETTNVLWLDEWIFTSPAQLEDGVQEIMDEHLNFDLSRRSLDTSKGAINWIENQLAAGYPVMILTDDGEHYQVISESIIERDKHGEIISAKFLTHDNSGYTYRSWSNIDYFFEDNWSAKIARFSSYTSYRDMIMSVMIEEGQED